MAFAFSIILALVHFFNEKITISNKLLRSRVISFVAGISVTYAFLELLPQAYKSFERLGKPIFVFIILGLTLVHVVEKYFYQNEHRKEELRHDLKEIHSIVFFIYYLFLGVILVELSQRGAVQATLFFIPLLFYAGIGLVALEKIHEKITGKNLAKIVLSISTIIGVVIAPYFLQSRIFFDALFGVVIGGFIYIALIDFVPKEKEGDPFYFVAGVVIYTMLLLILIP